MSNKTYELDGFPRWIERDWHKWYDIAKSYERAAKILLDAEITDRDSYSERDVLPILHILNVYIELVLKCLLVRSGGPVFQSHDIALLRREVTKTHPEILGRSSWAFIDFLNKIDRTGAAFKYPVDLAAREHFSEANGQHTIELGYLYPIAHQIFDEVNGFFRTKIF